MASFSRSRSTRDSPAWRTPTGSSGLPVATTLANGAVELIEPGESGLVLEEPFDEGLACLEDPDRLARMGEAARATAERYTWARHADEVLALYERRSP